MKLFKFERRLKAIVLLAIWVVVCLTPDHALQASDLNPGYTFSSGEQNVTHTKLNNLVNAATINTTFFTDKSATTTPASADTILLYSSSAAGFRKCTLGNLIFANTAVITGLTEDPAPATNDYLLSYDASAALLKKVSFSGIWTNADLINSRSNWVAPDSLTTFYLSYDGGIFTKQNRSNIFYNYANFATFTNVAQQTIPKGADRFLMFCPEWGSNRMTTLGGLITNSPLAEAAVQTGDFLWGYKQSNLTPVRVTFPWLATNVAPNILQRFSSGYYPLTAGQVANVAHGLSGTPQIVTWRAVCTNTAGDAATAYVYGDEVSVFSLSSFNVNPGANATNVFMSLSSSSWTIGHKTSGTAATPTARANFAAKCDATYYP